MPIYDYKCALCGHTWEARIYKTSDKADETVCHKCGTKAVESDKLPSKNVDHKIYGFSAKNGYGAKKFDDGRG